MAKKKTASTSEASMTDAYDRYWFWLKWLGARKGQRCRILARGAMNSRLIEFEDGYKVIASWRAVRKVPQ